MDARHRIVIVARTSLGNFQIELKQPAQASVLEFADEITIALTAEEAKTVSKFIDELVGDSVFSRIIGDPNFPARYKTDGR